jgi:hypothetical protein
VVVLGSHGTIPEDALLAVNYFRRGKSLLNLLILVAKCMSVFRVVAYDRYESIQLSRSFDPRGIPGFKVAQQVHTTCVKPLKSHCKCYIAK